MGSLDIDAVFDCLDPGCNGFISQETLQEFHQVLHFSPISSEHVEAAVGFVCGKDGLINRDTFLDVLLEIDRRRCVEERAFWDFRALDNNSDGKIPTKDALLLLRDTHGDQFSMATWKAFLSERGSGSADVCFHELRMWLCNPPLLGDSLDTELFTREENLLESSRLKKSVEEYDSAKHWQETASSKEKAEKDYRDAVLTQAERKLQKWEREGLEALIFDDGTYSDGVKTAKSRERVELKDLYHLLDEKYNLLRQRLICDMVLSNSESDLVDPLTGEIQGGIQGVENQVKELWRNKQISEKWMELPGAFSHLPFSLAQLTGQLANQDARNKAFMTSQHEAFLSEGKSMTESRQILEEKYQASLKGDQTYGGILADLLTRYNQERDSLASTIKSWLAQREATSQISGHYLSLLTQNVSITSEKNFVTAAMASGLRERVQVYKSTSYDWDRIRSEKLASLRIAENKGRQPRKAQLSSPEGNIAKKTALDLQEGIIIQMMENFAMEREIFIHLLHGPESVESKSTAKKLSEEERRGQLNSLRSQRQALRDGLTTTTDSSQTTRHRKLLQEGVGVVYESLFLERMKSEPNVTEDLINSSLLSDLQQRQAVALDDLIHDLISLDSRELQKLLKDLMKAFTNEYLDNIAFVIMGTLDVSDEERRFIDALEQKYKVIRETILVHVLRKQHGSAWTRMSAEQRQKELKELKKKEKKLRAAGRMSDMSSLLGATAKEMSSLRSLVGEDKGEHSVRIGEDEVSQKQTMVVNPLADLVVRQEAEQTFLLAWLRSPEVKVMTYSQRCHGLVRILLETCCVELESDYNCMGYRLGLIERIHTAITQRQSSDVKRLKQLAVLRCKERRQKLVLKKKFEKEPLPKDLPKPDDLIGWQMLYLNQVIQRHLEEGEQLLMLCQDDTLSELQEAAQTLSDEEKQQRLNELCNKRRQLDLENSDGREESLSILEEASAIKTLCRRSNLENAANHKSTVTAEDVACSLMDELLIEQDKELAMILQSLIPKDETEVKKLFEYETKARRWEMVENVVTVMTRFEGMATDDKLLQELDDKYDSLRDKLLLEALMRQIGEAEWQRLSEQERQRRLAMLKLQERKLRKEGKFDELSKLLGDHELMERNLRDLLGGSRAEAERKLRERLAERQRRLALGENIEDEDDESSEQVDSSGNVLIDLEKRYQQERDELLAKLHGYESHFMSEKERQAELLRLRREKRLAEREAKFDEAALALGLIEREQQISDKLKADKEREQALLRARLEMIRARKGKKIEEEKPVVLKEGDSLDLQDAVLVLLERRHHYEETRLVEMLSDNKYADLIKESQLKTEVEREDMLSQLKNTLTRTPIGHIKVRQDVLHQGIAVKSVSRGVTLAHNSDTTEVSHDDVCVSLMADLRHEQITETENLINTLPNMDHSQLISLQEEIIAAEKGDLLECVVAMVFKPEDQSDVSKGDILTALNGKYDALKDKLFIESLMKKVGEANWLKMSEKERQKRLVELKLQERKLREENKMDEVGRLLGEGLENQAAMVKLLGETKEEHNRKMREKLERRRQRLAQGLSEEKCDELEKQDEEEEEKNSTGKNILLELQHRYDQEIDELFKRMNNSEGKLSQEKQRQLELTRLKLQQRNIRQEDTFDSAALVLGLANEQRAAAEENFMSERERQLRLARERLEARRNGKDVGVIDKIELSNLGDINNEVTLRDTVLKVITARHQAERQYLMKLMKPYGGVSDSLSEANLDEEMKKLQMSYKTWQEGNDLTKLDQILKSAIAIKLKKKGADGKLAIEGEQEVMLADLQELEDRELLTLVESLIDKEVEDLKHMISVQSLKRTDAYHVNVAAVLLDQSVTPSLNDSSDEALIQALDNKYDALKVKIFAAVVKQRKGEDWWENATDEKRNSEINKLIEEDRRLREDGRTEEADQLLEGHLSQAGLQELFEKLGEGEVDEEARERLRDERLEAGMSLDEILQLEESKEDVDGQGKRTNILDKLKHEYDAEKAALLAGLQAQEDRLTAEKSRQLALAKLRREERRLKQEEKVDGAVLLFEMASDQRKKLQLNLDDERSRQKALAEQRLADRRNKQLNVQEDDVQRVEDSIRKQQQTDLLSDAENTDLTMIESILVSVEKKQTEERDMLFQLMDAVTMETAILDNLHSKTVEDLLTEQTNVKGNRDSWLVERQQSGELQSQSHNSQSLHKAATDRAEQFPLLKNALGIKLELMMRQCGNPDNRDDLLPKVKVEIMADLQTKQTAETENIQSELLKQLDEPLLQRVKDAQRRACTEGWYMTIAEVLFEPGFGGEEGHYQQQREAAIKNSKCQGLTAEETEAILKKLDAQHDIVLKKTKASREHHEREVKKRLEERKLSKYQTEDTADEVLNILTLSGVQAKQVTEVCKTEKLRQNSLMQERLAARRAARKIAAEQKAESEDSRPSTRDSKLSQGSSVQRLAVEVDGEVMKKQVNELLSQESNKHRKISEEQARQKEQLHRRLAQNPNRLKDEAVAVISLGERQKTMIEKSKQSEFDRQRSSVQERVAQVRFEKTMTMRDRSRSPIKTFDQIKEEAEKKGISLDDAMKEAAKDIEHKLKEEKDIQGSTDGLMDDSSREERLRQRRAGKKKKRVTLSVTQE